MEAVDFNDKEEINVYKKVALRQHLDYTVEICLGHEVLWFQSTELAPSANQNNHCFKFLFLYFDFIYFIYLQFSRFQIKGCC